MPRSPLVSLAVDELAQYVEAITEAAYIERTWSIKSVGDEQRGVLAGITGDDPLTKINASRAIYQKNLSYKPRASESVRIADLIYGPVGIGNFFDKVADVNENTVAGQIDLCRFDSTFNPQSSNKFKIVPLVRDDAQRLNDPTRQKPNLYGVKVKNPYLGPSTKDMSAVEVFMNSIPTLELSRCVPYLSVEVVSLGRTENSIPPLTLLGFLNPNAAGSADRLMISSQRTEVVNERGSIGSGYSSGMELFTSPQTLVNLGDTGFEYVPVIDRMQPLASLGSLNLTQKLVAGPISTIMGRLEVIVHDRSRLRELATLVRPDLYGTTFLDITYGWSHPEGGALSSNSYGKFLDALKNSIRFRISNSTYSFEEGGQIKITLSLQTVGSTDLMYLGPRNVENSVSSLEEAIKSINSRLSDLKGRGLPGPAMAPYGILETMQDPSSILKSAAAKETLKKIKDLIQRKGADAEIVNLLKQLFGQSVLSKDPTLGGKLAETRASLALPYTKIIDSLPTMGRNANPNDQSTFDDELSREFDGNRFSSLDDDAYVNTAEKDVQVETIGSTRTPFQSPSNYVSYGSVFMRMVAQPIAESGKYEEVQVIFYPFNKFAGAVHDLPVSCFPIERNRLRSAVSDLAGSTPELSARALIGLLTDRFTGFAPDRAYLMADFYDQKKAEAGEVEGKEYNDVSFSIPGKKGTVRGRINTQLTQELRLRRVGIPEAKFVKPVVEVSVEASKMFDPDGKQLFNSDGTSKTILKLHVFDRATDPGGPMVDLLKAAKDNELGVIAIPLAEYNRAASGITKTESIREKYKINEILKAGIDSGLLKVIDNESLQEIGSSGGPQTQELVNGIINGTKLARIRGSYDDVKRLVKSGVPSVTYGSSVSVITNASLTTGGSAGLPNVMMQRAYTTPAEAAPDSAASGVPMQIIPAQLSLSTIGFPLFHPMQSLFVDFGTGTSIDNIYRITEVNSTIGKDGFKTDLKLSFGEGFATYTSLNQNLAMLFAGFRDTLAESGQSVSTTAATIEAATNAVEDTQRKIDEQISKLRTLSKLLATPAANLKVQARVQVRKLAKKIANGLAALANELKKKALEKLSSIPGVQQTVKLALLAVEKLKVAAAAARRIAREIQAGKALGDLAVAINDLTQFLSQGVVGRIAEEIRLGIADAEAEALAKAERSESSE